MCCPFVTGRLIFVAQDEIHRRPRISTLLARLSRYEAVASPQRMGEDDDDDEGEDNTAKPCEVL